MNAPPAEPSRENLRIPVRDFRAVRSDHREVCPANKVTRLETYEAVERSLDPDFWAPYPHARAREFVQFVAMAKGGQRYTPPADRPAGPRSPALTRRQQRYDLEQSVVYCRTVLGLGRR